MRYGPNTITNGLVLALDTSDKNSYTSGSTTWYDLIGNNHFTLYNTPTFANNFGGELQFNGSTNYARDRNNTIINSIASNCTVEIWCRSYGGSFNGSTGPNGRLISFADDTGTGSDSTSTQGTNNDYSTFFCLAQPTTDAQYFSLYYKNNPIGFGSTTSINTDKYFQVIMNWNTSGGNITFNHYLNASNVSSQTNVQSAYTNANNITLAMNCNGAFLSPSENLKAAYSIVRLYNRTLTASEITQNYNTTKARFGL